MIETLKEKNNAQSVELEILPEQIKEYLKQNKPNLAEKLLIQTINQDKDDIQSIIWLGFVYLEQEKYSQAEQLLTYSLRQHPNNTKLIALLANIHVNQDKFDKAENILRHAISLDIDNPVYYIFLGELYSNQGKYQLVEDIFKKALQLHPNDSGLIHNLAIMYIEQDQYDQAEVLFKEAIKLKPTEIKFHNGLAYIYYTEQKYHKAELLINKALDLSPNHFNILSNLAKIYVKTKRLNAAKKIFKQLLENDPSDIQTLSSLARIYYKDENFSSAMNMIEESIKYISPNNFEEYRKKIKALDEIKKFYIYKKYMKKIDSNLKDFDYYMRKGILLSDGNFKGASIEHLKTAEKMMLELDDYQPQIANLIYTHLLLNYLKVGNKNKAREIQKKLTLLPPLNKEKTNPLRFFNPGYKMDLKCCDPLLSIQDRDYFQSKNELELINDFFIDERRYFMTSQFYLGSHVGMYHELGNKLNNIDNTIYRAKKQLNKPDSIATVKKYLNTALEEVALLKERLDHIQKMSKNKDFYHIENIAVKKLIESSIIPYKKRIADLKVQIHNHIDVNVKVKANWYVLTLSIENMINNALDMFSEYKTDQEKKLTFQIDYIINNDREINLLVIDNGKGIKESVKRKIFREPVSGSEGSGIGLQLCYRLLQDMTEDYQPRLEFETEENKGTTFKIRLKKGQGD